MDAVRFGRFCIRLISMFEFGILQIPKGCIQTGSGCAAAAGYSPGFTSPKLPLTVHSPHQAISSRVKTFFANLDSH